MTQGRKPPRRKYSELNPRAELRDWSFRGPHRFAGDVFDDQEDFYPDGEHIILKDFTHVEYKDHLMITSYGNVYIAYKLNRQD